MPINLSQHNTNELLLGENKGVPSMAPVGVQTRLQKRVVPQLLQGNSWQGTRRA